MRLVLPAPKKPVGKRKAWVTQPFTLDDIQIAAGTTGEWSEDGRIPTSSLRVDCPQNAAAQAERAWGLGGARAALKKVSW